LLSRHAAERLAALSADLSREFPSDDDRIRLLLEPGETAGPSDPLLIPRAKVCIAALEEAADLCDTRIGVARLRLKNAGRWRMIGEVVAAIGSISVLGTLAAKWGVGAVLSAVVALVGSFSSLCTKWALETIDSSQGTMSERYTRLIAFRYDARRLRVEIGMQAENFGPHTDEAALAKLIGDANALCRDINVVDVI
jgi:hypothetical protein